MRMAFLNLSFWALSVTAIIRVSASINAKIEKNEVTYPCIQLHHSVLYFRAMPISVCDKNAAIKLMASPMPIFFLSIENDSFSRVRYHTKPVCSSAFIQTMAGMWPNMKRWCPPISCELSASSPWLSKNDWPGNAKRVHFHNTLKTELCQADMFRNCKAPVPLWFIL